MTAAACSHAAHDMLGFAESNHPIGMVLVATGRADSCARGSLICQRVMCLREHAKCYVFGLCVSCGEVL